MIRRWALMAPAMVVLGAVALGMVACGGDDDDGGSTGDGAVSDEGYVTTVCAAAAKVSRTADDLRSDGSASEVEKALRQMAEPVETYGKELAEAKPPADVKTAHAELVTAIQGLAKTMKDGNVAAARAFDPTKLPLPAADVQARLKKIADKNPDCEESEFFANFDDDAGGGTDGAEEYVAAVCAATAEFADAVLTISEEFIDSDAEPEAKVFLEPFDTYLKAMAKAKPPAEFKAYHTQLVEAGRSVEALLKKGDLEAALAGEPFPEPPDDQLERLGAIAATNDDCMASGTFLG